MKAGGQRTVEIPPNLGYGADGYPPNIPGNATLVFDITLNSVR
jgi:FKBP-type peptidyl-prolyl cis-trans isomerase